MKCTRVFLIVLNSNLIENLIHVVNSIRAHNGYNPFNYFYPRPLPAHNGYIRWYQWIQ